MLDPRTHTFLEVYRRRSFTRTAEELHLSQPAVSQHIRWLEERLDARLFVKQGRAVTPTRAADILYLRLSCLENDDARIAAEVRAAADEAAEMTLRFGATRTIADYVMPRILPRQLDADPDVRLTMVVGNTNELVTRLDRGDIGRRPRRRPFRLLGLRRDGLVDRALYRYWITQRASNRACRALGKTHHRA